MPMADHFKHWITRQLTGDLSVPFHMLFHEKWDRAMWREYRRAVRYDGAVDKKALRRVWILSYSCSGTHNFYTHFHYMPGAFALAENLFIDRQADPYQLCWRVDRLRPAHFLFGSAFLQQGLQYKDGSRLKHVFLLSNHYLKFPHPVNFDNVGEHDRMIFYQRNFVRVLYSHDRDSRKFNKPHFAVTDEYFAAAVASHRAKIEEMLRLSELHGDRAMFCFHELFCASPARIMGELCESIGIAAEDRQGWDDPAGFFKRCYRSSELPERRGEWLWCPVLDIPIRGKGGDYNPLPDISLERTISAPVREWMPAVRLDLLRRTFGDELVDFWMNDDSFNYASATTEGMVAMLRRSVGK